MLRRGHADVYNLLSHALLGMKPASSRNQKHVCYLEVHYLVPRMACSTMLLYALTLPLLDATPAPLG